MCGFCTSAELLHFNEQTDNLCPCKGNAEADCITCVYLMCCAHCVTLTSFLRGTVFRRPIVQWLSDTGRSFQLQLSSFKR